MCTLQWRMLARHHEAGCNTIQVTNTRAFGKFSAVSQGNCNRSKSSSDDDDDNRCKQCGTVAFQPCAPTGHHLPVLCSNMRSQKHPTEPRCHSTNGMDSNVATCMALPPAACSTRDQVAATEVAWHRHTAASQVPPSSTLIFGMHEKVTLVFFCMV